MNFGKQTLIKTVRTAALAGFVSVAIAGCKSMESTATPSPSTPAPAAPAAAKPLAVADLTHSVNGATPYFTSIPAPGEASAGMMPAGTKCLLMVPGTKYSKIMCADGMTCYVPTTSLEPMKK